MFEFPTRSATSVGRVGNTAPSPEPQEGHLMAELKKYEAVVNGYPTTLLLTDEDAEARGLKAKAAAKPANKAVDPPANKAVKKPPAKKAAK